MRRKEERGFRKRIKAENLIEKWKIRGGCKERKQDLNITS